MKEIRGGSMAGKAGEGLMVGIKPNMGLHVSA